MAFSYYYDQYLLHIQYTVYLEGTFMLKLSKCKGSRPFTLKPAWVTNGHHFLFINFTSLGTVTLKK